MQEQIRVMNARSFITMTCNDPLCQQMIPETLEAIGKISRSEPMTMMENLALEMIIELLQIDRIGMIERERTDESHHKEIWE
jgi:hypothetical protein